MSKVIQSLLFFTFILGWHAVTQANCSQLDNLTYESNMKQDENGNHQSIEQNGKFNEK